MHVTVKLLNVFVADDRVEGVTTLRKGPRLHEFLLQGPLLLWAPIPLYDFARSPFVLFFINSAARKKLLVRGIVVAL
jgi:hypothetical protein